MISTPKRFDWKLIKQRLRDNEAALERASLADETQLQQVHRQRQVDYAHRKSSSAASGAVRRVLVFLLGTGRFAVDLAALVKVFPLSQCTFVPGAPKEIVGVINVGGEICSVVDAAEMLGLALGGDRGEGQVVLLRHEDFEVGLRVDHVEAIENVNAGSLSRPENTEHSPSVQFVEGVTSESLIVLNVRQLMSHSIFQSDAIENKGTNHDHW